jgi:hypothetical protein
MEVPIALASQRRNRRGHPELPDSDILCDGHVDGGRGLAQDVVNAHG